MYKQNNDYKINVKTTEYEDIEVEGISSVDAFCNP